MNVRTAMRSTGGVVISESSRTPVNASCSVRGIGVADSVSTCTSLFSSFSRSLCLTPKCCSSSTISRPRFLNEIDEPSSACVPTTTSTVPSPMPFLVSASAFGPTSRDACLTCTGSPAKRCEKVLKCWRASSVVGTTTATCNPSSAATKAARSATSVLPKPTSPQISRSIGLPADRSSMTMSIAVCWSSVSS